MFSTMKGKIFPQIKSLIYRQQAKMDLPRSFLREGKGVK
jgi:hypothetical protein